MQQFSRPLAPAEAVFCFPPEPDITEGPEYEKYQHYIDKSVLNNYDTCNHLFVVVDVYEMYHVKPI